MTDVISFLEVSAIVFVASAFRTAFGFGEALIAVPLLAFLLPMKQAAPLAVLCSILIAGIVIVRDHEHIHLGSAKRLLLATVAGLPFGLVILRYAPEGVMKGALGLVLLGFSIFSLAQKKSFALTSDRPAWFFGFLAGVLGGSYGMNGPPLAIYGAGRGWMPDQFRATLQAYFLPASVLGMVGYYFTGVWTRDVNVLFVSALPAVICGICSGNWLTRKMGAKRFARFLYGGLIIVAGLLLLQAINLSSL
jgi:uncharacterized membrane protein YfcA